MPKARIFKSREKSREEIKKAFSEITASKELGKEQAKKLLGENNLGLKKELLNNASEEDLIKYAAAYKNRFLTTTNLTKRKRQDFKTEILLHMESRASKAAYDQIKTMKATEKDLATQITSTQNAAPPELDTLKANYEEVVLGRRILEEIYKSINLGRHVNPYHNPLGYYYRDLETRVAGLLGALSYASFFDSSIRGHQGIGTQQNLSDSPKFKPENILPAYSKQIERATFKTNRDLAQTAVEKLLDPDTRRQAQAMLDSIQTWSFIPGFRLTHDQRIEGLKRLKTLNSDEFINRDPPFEQFANNINYAIATKKFNDAIDSSDKDSNTTINLRTLQDYIAWSHWRGRGSDKQQQNNALVQAATLADKIRLQSFVTSLNTQEKFTKDKLPQPIKYDLSKKKINISSWAELKQYYKITDNDFSNKDYSKEFQNIQIGYEWDKFKKQYEDLKDRDPKVKYELIRLRHTLMCGTYFTRSKETRIKAIQEATNFLTELNTKDRKDINFVQIPTNSLIATRVNNIVYAKAESIINDLKINNSQDETKIKFIDSILKVANSSLTISLADRSKILLAAVKILNASQSAQEATINKLLESIKSPQFVRACLQYQLTPLSQTIAENNGLSNDKKMAMQTIIDELVFRTDLPKGKRESVHSALKDYLRNSNPENLRVLQDNTTQVQIWINENTSIFNRMAKQRVATLRGANETLGRPEVQAAPPPPKAVPGATAAGNPQGAVRGAPGVGKLSPVGTTENSHEHNTPKV